MIESFQQFERQVETPKPLHVETELEPPLQAGQEEIQTMENQKVNKSSVDIAVQIYDLICELNGNEIGYDTQITRIEIGYRIGKPLDVTSMMHMPPDVVVKALLHILDFAPEADLQERVGEDAARMILEAREKGETCLTLSENCKQLRIWAELMDEKNIRSDANHVGSFGMNKCIASLYAGGEFGFGELFESRMKALGYISERFTRPGRSGQYGEGYTMTRYRHVKAETE